MVRNYARENMYKGNSLKDYRPEQFLAKDITTDYLNAFRRIRSLDYDFEIIIEHPIKDWQLYGEVEGIRLKGMPVLDLYLKINNHETKKQHDVGIRLNGKSHNTTKRRLTDQDHMIVLEGNGWLIVDFNYWEMENLFALKQPECISEVTMQLRETIQKCVGEENAL